MTIPPCLRASVVPTEQRAANLPWRMAAGFGPCILVLFSRL